MQQRSIRKDAWAVFAPLLLKLAVDFVIESIIVAVCYLQYLPEVNGNAISSERMNEIMVEITEMIYPYMTEIAAFSALVSIPFLLIMMNGDKHKEKKLGVVWSKKAPLLKYGYVAIMGAAFSLGLNNILLLSNLAEYSESYQETAEMLYAPSFPVQILCVGIVIPIAEELIFRGLIYRRMRQNVSMIQAMIFSSLIFGFYHGNSVQFIFAACAGMILSYVYEKYGSIKASMIGHMLINMMSLVLTEEDVFTWIFSNMTRMAVITIGCAAIASTMFVCIRGIESKAEEVENVTKQ